MKNTVIKAHKRVISYLALNFSGSILATSSQTGAKIKIYHTETGQLLQELRRGISRAEILQLTFHRSSKFLACTSDKETIHIFELYESASKMQELGYNNNTEDSQENEIIHKNDLQLEPSVRNKINKFATIGSWLISYLSSHWSLSRVKLNDKRKHCAFGDGNNFIVISSSGKMYEYEIPQIGGYCKLRSSKKFQ